MPYTIDNPPDVIKNLPKHAQEIFIAAFNSAFEQYKDETRARQTAWAAVKTKYEKKGDKGVSKESVKGIRQQITIDQILCPECGGEKFDNEGTFLKCCNCNTLVESKKEKDMSNSIIAEIVKESSKRQVDNQRIKNVVKLGDELTPDQIKEAESVLAWIKEQPFTKLEEGTQYPSEAFAYAPDVSNPDTWNLRIWESATKRTTKSQLNKASAFLSPGGFRGQKVSIQESDLASVKRKIRSEYRKLGVEDEDIPKWVSEAEKRTVLTGYTPLTEAKVSGKGTAQLTIIQPGFNATQERYYPSDTLSRDFPVFEGVKMYADHPTEDDERNRPERSIRDWVATLKNVRMENGNIIGDAEVIEPWMQERLATLRDKGMLKEMGISINAIGSASVSEVEGIKTTVIEKIIRARSVDFVTEPGAGGKVEMYESIGEVDIDIISLATLKEHRPDLVKQLESSVRNEISQEVKKLAEQEDKIKALESENETLTKENTDLKTQKEAGEKAQRIAEAKSKIDEALGKSELPEPAKARILEKFKDSETVDSLEEAIKAEKDYIAAITESGKVKGMGKKVEGDPKASREALKESVKAMHPEYTDGQIDAFLDAR